ncbi:MULTISPECIES: hypothetical protein [unclassified Bradyrhizobium]
MAHFKEREFKAEGGPDFAGARRQLPATSNPTYSQSTIVTVIVAAKK